MIKSTVYLFNVDQEQDLETGERTNVVVNTRKLLAEIGQVGSVTYWNATSLNVALSHTIQMPYNSYSEEKYLAFRSKGEVRVLTINNTSAGSRSHLIKIHCRATEKDIEELILNVFEKELPLE